MQEGRDSNAGSGFVKGPPVNPQNHFHQRKKAAVDLQWAVVVPSARGTRISHHETEVLDVELTPWRSGEYEHMPANARLRPLGDVLAPLQRDELQEVLQSFR